MILRFVILILMELYPEAIRYKNHHGQYPLHIACLTHQSDRVIQELIKQFPFAVQEKDSFGLLSIALCLYQLRIFGMYFININ
jgi:hypothetical protein